MERATFTVTDWDHSETELIIFGKAKFEVVLTFRAVDFHLWLLSNNYEERKTMTWKEKYIDVDWDFQPWIIQRFLAENMIGWFIKVEK